MSKPCSRQFQNHFDFHEIQKSTAVDTHPEAALQDVRGAEICFALQFVYAFKK
jgi:hypothetical protein